MFEQRPEWDYGLNNSAGKTFCGQQFWRNSTSKDSLSSMKQFWFTIVSLNLSTFLVMMCGFTRSSSISSSLSGGQLSKYIRSWICSWTGMRTCDQPINLFLSPRRSYKIYWWAEYKAIIANPIYSTEDSRSTKEIASQRAVRWRLWGSES